MRLTWHIIWKDLRAQRWPLLLWASLFLGQAVLGFMVSGWDITDALANNLKIGNALLVGAQFVVGYVLVVQCVQADDVAGTRMFWLTRPISGGRLFLAKFTQVAGLFALLPALCLLPWWLYNGFMTSDVAWAAAEFLGWQLVIIAPAFLIASLTDDLGRAIMIGLVLVAVMLAGVIVLPRNIGAGVKLAADVMGAEFTAGSSRLFAQLWYGGLILATGSVPVAAHQFLTRHFVRSTALAAVVVGLAFLARVWPWHQLRPPALFGKTRTENVVHVPMADLHVKAEPAQFWKLPEYHGRGEEWQLIHRLTVTGVPENLTVHEARLRQSWTWSDGTTSTAETFPLGYVRPIQLYPHSRTDQSLPLLLALGMSRPAEDPETVRWLKERDAERSARGFPSLFAFSRADPEPDSIWLQGVGEPLDTATIDRLRADPPSGQAQLEMDFLQPHALLELPVKSGARWTGRSLALRLGGEIVRSQNSASAAVQAVLATPSTWENRPLWRAIDSNLLSVNRRGNTLSSADVRSNLALSGRVVLGGVSLEWRTLGVTSARVVRNGQWVARDPDWLQHTTLVLLDPQTPVMRVTRELSTDKYEARPLERRKPHVDEADKAAGER